MPPLRIMIHQEASDAWTEVGRIMPGDQPGSMSDNTEHGRDIYVWL